MASLDILKRNSIDLKLKQTIMASEDSLKEKLQTLQKQLGKKQTFEEAVSSIKSLLIENYSSASPSLRKSIYSVVCRVATILQTRYTAPGFWLAGKVLFEEAERLVSDSLERRHMRTCIAKACERLHEVQNQPEVSESIQRSQKYLFEGHLTVDTEPQQPGWLLAQQLLIALGTAAESSQSEGENNMTTEQVAQALSSVVDFHGIEDVIQASLQDLGAGPSRRPPASKDVVKKLPIITITEEVLVRLGSKTDCAVCREDLVINDKMQELPCKHLFHPPCLKPWLDEHNSCPICRHELPTDDHAYESKKERDKEAEEEQKGAANALPGGEFMYV